MEDVFKLTGKITVENSEANRNIDEVTEKAESASQKMQKSFETIGDGLKKVGDKITGAGKFMTATLTTGFGALVAGGINYNAQMQEFQMNLTTLLGSSDKATKLLNDLKDMAATTPFETTDLISATQTMIGFGIASDDAQKYLGVLGDISMGNSEKLSGLALAFSQVQSTGKLTGQDLLQMINQGFNPLLYISKMTGESMAEVKERMSDGAVSAQEVADAFEYATQKGQPFYNAMENGANTVSGRLSTLKDNFQMAVGSLTESLLPTFEKLVDKLIEITEKFQSLSPEQKENILKWGAIVAVAGPALIIFGKLTSGLGGLFSIIGKVKGAGGLAGLVTKFKGLMVVAGPVIGIIAGVIAALGLLVYVLGGPKEALEKLKQGFEWCKEVIQEFLDRINFGDKLQTIKDKLGEFGEKLKGLKDLFQVIGTVIGIGLQPALAVLAGLFNGVMSAIGPLLDALGGIIDILAGIGTFIKSVFTGDWQGAWDSIKQIVGGFKDFFAGIWDAIWALIGGFFEGIIEWFAGLFEKLGITEFFSNVWNAITEWWAGVVLWWQNAWTSITNFFVSVGDWINTNVIQPILGFFQSLWDGIKAVWDGICLAIEIAIGLIASIFDAALQIILLPFTFIWENCKEYIIAFIDKAKELIGIVVSWIVERFNNLKQNVLTIWGLIKEYIIQPIVDAYNKIKEVIGIVVSWVVDKFNNLKAKIHEAFQAIKEYIVQPIVEMYNTVKQWIQNLVADIITKFNNLKSNATSIFSSIKDYIVGKITELKNKVITTFNNVKDAMEKPIKNAKNTIKNIIDTIKGMFSNLKLKFPNIKLPHFGITPKGWEIGDLLKGKIPKLKIDWYAKAMNNPVILDKPTAFGMTPEGSVMAGGEAGKEVVSGADTLMSMISSAVDNKNALVIERVESILTVLVEWLPKLANMKMVTDTGVLVGEMVEDMDYELGKLKERKERGR